MSNHQVFCFKCSKPTPIVSTVGFRDECLHCGEDLHVCKNCEFYDQTAYNECREPSADRVKEKERANFCEYFQPSQQSGSNGAEDSRKKLLAEAEALFKKK
ncbi:MAG: hypothetical protein MK008_08615 [Bdellovibrionales bacterium]|nr:hypothetical protein [Bdellovibrionales bacterium]